jgi:DNA uptake protein ComE-like DNA-binding protein
VKLPLSFSGPGRAGQDPAAGSVLIVVLWIALGLVTITLYFANSMSLEMRSAENRVSSLAADQAIEGAARYVTYVLSNLETNGLIPDLNTYESEAVLLGEARFWLIGRSDRSDAGSTPFFALVDEASKLNLNTATAIQLESLPWMTAELAAAIVDWRDTDEDVTDAGAESETYSRLHPSYVCKSAPFETVDELRLVFGATLGLLVGEDANRNGVLDPGELDEDRDNRPDPGILEYVTVYTREPNGNRTNVNDRTQLTALLREQFGTARANEILAALGGTATNLRSLLEFYVRGRMKPEELAQIGDLLTTTNGTFLEGRVNVNTASQEVLSCLPGIGTDHAPTLVSYRQTNPDKLTSIAWVAEVLDQANAIRAGPFLTTQSYQFSADVAALGPHGRGYRRTRFVFDTSEDTPRIIYRQDLTHLGWALGAQVRQSSKLAQQTR